MSIEPVQLPADQTNNHPQHHRDKQTQEREAHVPNKGQEHALSHNDLIRIGFVGLAILAVWFRIWEPFAKVSILGVAATLIGGWPIFKEALENLLQRRMTMELSMTIALVAALAIGEFRTALIIVFFVLIAEVLEGLTVGRGRRAIKHLVDLLPRSAFVRRSTGTTEVSVEEIRIGDVVIVKPGTRIAVDGVVLSGHSAVDQSPITGESLPVEKIKGSEVYAGTINQSGVLEVEVRNIGRNTAFGRIIEAVERAETLRAPIQKTADTLAGYLVYFALGCALLTFLITRDARSTISVVIVAGACGIAAGTPLAVLGGIGRAARNGVIIKGGVYLEALGKIDTIVFDKTGTLTLGKPIVSHIRAAANTRESDVIEAAAIAERNSEHPLARAILEKANEVSLPFAEPDAFQYTPGKGVECSYGGETILIGSGSFVQDHGFDISGFPASDAVSEVLVARGGRLLGRIGIADGLRLGAAQAISEIHKMGLRTMLLTGDTAAVAQTIARELGIDAVQAELLPQQKAESVRRLRQQGHTVAMVGDGINDAPALIEANVGIAMGAGTDVARESADIVLIGDDFKKLVESLRIARWCRRIILTNFAGTLLVDGVGVGLAAFGMLNPLLAALIHVVSELVFILNSARLLPAAVGVPSGKPMPERSTLLVAEE
jgi:Cd2+/Zn2+-exporting ATPase/Cu+-exporting ATPase